ncbi:hypothetical protein A7981_04355 [Methylovorus sp. MM2]|uniref:protein NO VEIN domain-containing protein n=1 Tax=Methylovorus sp. MM2 TaxID=1848038 RepID=UPI0007DFDC93|nr:DUF3883 domain-containing protein [Methylovorus sp. MM2]OAM52690.1 hypothetical protein A7981_04355 [Methylovorus sp. MM2]
MSFSVGALYSSVKFLQHLQAKPVSHEEFKASFQMFGVASADIVLQVSQDCGWIALDGDGLVFVTDKGLNILSQGNPIDQLRTQIIDMISFYEPLWARKIPSGRAEARSALPADASQCFKEAGLLDSWTDELIEWWDTLGHAAKAKKSTALLKIGRDAERRSVEHETQRTGEPAKWQSLESNFSGFDVLSQVEPGNKEPLKIEVKGSTMGIKEAYFTLTRNEWNVAETSKNYCLHLWSLNANPVNLIVVDKEKLIDHLPNNLGHGKWETVRIPFNAFK